MFKIYGRIISIVLIITFLLTVFTGPVYSEGAQSKGNAQLGIFKVTKKPVIDGVAEQVWKDYSKNIVIFHYDAVTGSSENYQCVSYLLWDEENLYLLAEINDTTPMQNTQTGSNIWNGDGVELFIGTDMTSAGSVLPGDRQLILSGGLIDGKPQYHWYNNAPQTEVDMAVRMGADGASYLIEAAIPWSGFGIVPEIGLDLRFDLYADDGFDGGRKVQFSWNSNTSDNYKDRSNWGSARLAAETTHRNHTLDIPQAAAPITIDGILDSEWPDVDSVSLAKNNINAIKGGSIPDDDVYSETYFTWDKNFLYVFQDVNDPTPMRNIATGDGVWNGDTFELFFGSEKVNEGGSYLPTDRQLILSSGKNYDGTFNYWWYKSDQQYAVNMVVKEKTQGSGYVLEAAIPWEGISLINPEIGTEVRFDFGMGEGAGQGRIAQYMWNCMVETNHLNRDNWGKLTLAAGISATKEDADMISEIETPDYSRHYVLHIPKTAETIVIDGIKDNHWPEGSDTFVGSENLVIGNPANPVEASMNFAWDHTNLYVFAHYKDATPMVNAFTGPEIWNGDGLGLFFGPNDLKTTGKLLQDDRQIIISGGLADDQSVKYHFYNAESQGTITAVVKKDADGKGYTIEASIPWNQINISNPIKNRAFRFDMSVDGSDSRERNQQSTWNSKLDNLYAYRDNWGMAILVDRVSVMDDPATRAEALSAVIEAMKFDLADYNGSFSDIITNLWFADAVETAFKTRIAKGYGGPFKPDNAITVEELVTFMTRAYSLVRHIDGVSLERYTDKNEVSSWALDSMEKAVALGLLGSGNKLNPKSTLTREELDVILKKFVSVL